MGFGRIFPYMLVLVGCSSGEARHLPLNPLLLPVHATSAAWDNATYSARRSKVEAHVAAHHAELLREIDGGRTGPQLTEAYELARVPEAERPALTLSLGEDRSGYAASLEALVVALMVHGV